jgi:hypothetical protein
MPPFEVTSTQVMAFKNFLFSGSSYFHIGSGLLPFSITPVDATSPADRAILAATRGRADVFDLGTDHESGAIAPSDVGRLRNTGGYIPQIWTDYRAQLCSTSGLVGAVVGNNHPVILAYGRFLCMCESMQTCLESELEYAHGRRLGPAMMSFHAQVAWRNWLVTQLNSSERSQVSPPDFCQGLNMLESQNNLMWFPTVTNAPALLALCASRAFPPLVLHLPELPQHRPWLGQRWFDVMHAPISQPQPRS